MVKELSPQIEHFLASVVAQGFFPSEQAALEAAVAALQEKLEPVALTEEQAALIEQGLASLHAGRCRKFSAEDWQELRSLAGNADSGHQ